MIRFLFWVRWYHVLFRSFNVNHNRRRYTNNNNKKVISVGGQFLPKFFRLFTFSRQELSLRKNRNQNMKLFQLFDKLLM